jgi:predicted RNA-binding protein YlqC (UPF0109 family)
MEALVRHLIEPFVRHPDAVDLRVIEGDAAYILELSVHDEDRPAFTEDDGRVLRHVRTILSAAAGSKKATIELVDDDAGGAEE